MLEFSPMTPASAEIRESAAFALTVDFVKGKGDPSRPFRTMIGLIEALGRFDQDLVRSVDVQIEPLLLLEDVEAGSIKSWLATVLRSADDTALQSGDWKRVVGDYLVKGKYELLRKLDGATSITDPKLLEDLQSGLLVEAEKTNVRGLPGYAPMSRTRLAAHIADVTTSLEYLEDGDTATYESRNERAVPFNRSLRVDDAEMTELLSIRTISNEDQMILKVKKPDFLGSSMWEFHYEGHAIEARIEDYQWLDSFHTIGAIVLPGGALRAIVRVEVSYDDQNEALPPRHTVLKVLEVLPPPAREQLRLHP
jgi:hypothetical protein